MRLLIALPFLLLLVLFALSNTTPVHLQPLAHRLLTGTATLARDSRRHGDRVSAWRGAGVAVGARPASPRATGGACRAAARGAGPGAEGPAAAGRRRHDRAGEDLRHQRIRSRSTPRSPPAPTGSDSISSRPRRATSHRHRRPSCRRVRRAVRRVSACSSIRRRRQSPRRSTRCGWTSCSSTARSTLPRCAPGSACRSGARSPSRALPTCRPSLAGPTVCWWKPSRHRGRRARRQRGAFRLVAAARLARAGAVDPGRRPDRGQRRGGDPCHRRIGGGCVLGGGTRARGEGSDADPRVHRQCTRRNACGFAAPRRRTRMRSGMCTSQRGARRMPA